MHYHLIAHDFPGAEAAQRRAELRTQHMQNLRRLRADGRLVEGGAIVDEEGRMCGSILLFEFEKEEELKEYLDGEVFNQGVWSEVAVTPFRRVDWEKLMA